MSVSTAGKLNTENIWAGIYLYLTDHNVISELQRGFWNENEIMLER